MMTALAFGLSAIAPIALGLWFMEFLLNRKNNFFGVVVAVITLPLAVFSGIIGAHLFAHNYSNETVVLEYINDSIYGDEYFSISCFSDNDELYVYVRRDKVKVELRKDNQDYTNIKFGSKNIFTASPKSYYDSATILVPVEEDVQKWQKWIEIKIKKYNFYQQQKYKPSRIVPGY